MSEHKVYIIPREQVVKIAETKRMILVPDKIPDHIHLVSADEHDYSQPGEWQPNNGFHMTASFTQEVTKQQFKKICKKMFPKTRYPRKIKKVFKHIEVINYDPETHFNEDKEKRMVNYQIDFIYKITTHGGYPRTKWFWKAYRVVKRLLENDYRRMTASALRSAGIPSIQ